MAQITNVEDIVVVWTHKELTSLEVAEILGYGFQSLTSKVKRGKALEKFRKKLVAMKRSEKSGRPDKKQSTSEVYHELLEKYQGITNDNSSDSEDEVIEEKIDINGDSESVNEETSTEIINIALKVKYVDETSTTKVETLQLEGTRDEIWEGFAKVSSKFKLPNGQVTDTKTSRKVTKFELQDGMVIRIVPKITGGSFTSLKRSVISEVLFLVK